MRARRRHRRSVALGALLTALGACIPDVDHYKPGVCLPDETQCAGTTVETCGPDYQWHAQQACSGSTPFCVAGACREEPRSCDGLAKACGPSGTESCCSSLPLDKGTFKRFENGDTTPHTAKVSAFQLDRFEVTVSRFRKFVEAYPGSRPAPGAGAHPHIDKSGWQPAWDKALPKLPSDLRAVLRCDGDATWTDAPGANEAKPINCVDWYLAFAFCAWDGGRLPTEAEWEYAATVDAHGGEPRNYPWGSAAPSPDLAIYCSILDPTITAACPPRESEIAVVGSRSPMGDGPWKHADLAGNVWEWVLDAPASYGAGECVDCANLDDMGKGQRGIRGGSWNYGAYFLPGGLRTSTPADQDKSKMGIRCARTL